MKYLLTVFLLTGNADPVYENYTVEVKSFDSCNELGFKLVSLADVYDKYLTFGCEPIKQ